MKKKRAHLKRPIGKRAFRINEFCAAYGIGRTKTYDLIKQQKLRTVLVGGRRLVHIDDAEALFADEPP
jgi:predicted DNA-binding transcriptional regulator AlpA